MNNKDQSIGSILVNQDYMCYIIFSSWKEYKMQVKPSKKTDTELFKLIESCIKRKNYIFLKHSKYRMLERRISDLDIINILLGIKTNLRVRNKKKDSYDYYIR